MNFAPNDVSLEPNPDWVRLDDTDNLVASYTIDRGRQVETDTTDGGRATVQINDRYGVLDPTNGVGPYAGLIQPLIQVTLGRHDPIADVWQTRFRGFILDWGYAFDPSQRVNRLTLDLVDIFEILNTIEMLPGQFGDDPVTGGAPQSAGQVWFASARADVRLDQLYGNAGIPPEFFVNFEMNVDLWATVYSPGESALVTAQEAVEGEFPGVANLYPDRFGRAAAHGRLSKFDPATIAAGAGDAAWDWHHWHCGDAAAVAGAPSTTAQIREFAFNRGLSQVINSAFATPLYNASGNPLTAAEITAQIAQDATSIGKYGIRSWSRQNLLTKTGLLDSSDSLAEVFKFVQWRLDNYAVPRNRVSLLTVKSMRPDWPGAEKTWDLLGRADISDQIDITVTSPGGGGFGAEPFFIEGIHEQSTPLNADYDMDTMSFDVSPAGLYADPENRFPTP